MAEPSKVVGPVGGLESELYLSRWDVDACQRCWPLHAGLMTIGRGPSADVVIEGDLLVSRLHSTLERVAGVWMIVDNGLSCNGTFINNHQITDHIQLHNQN